MGQEPEEADGGARGSPVVRPELPEAIRRRGLLRLAKGSKIRRFKGEGGEFVYTASTGAVRIGAPMQPVGVKHAPEEEAAPALENGVEEEEEQLDLDAPTAN